MTLNSKMLPTLRLKYHKTNLKAIHTVQESQVEISLSYGTLYTLDNQGFLKN